ncbi:hypothetical protein F4811DRAFT_570651 [Daldinia bambusicola]|nr:hypothetical protein F4811DRAFT_570651 [Daldinia bambusicola]
MINFWIVVVFSIVQGGVKVVNAEFTDPFTKIEPAGLINTRFPIYLETYDIQAQRDVYDLLSSATHETLALNGSIFFLEGYPLQGVQAIPEESTAFPFRGDSLLLVPFILFKTEGEELNKKATKLGKDLRQIIHKATGREEMHSYVNYAIGSETKK